MSTDAGAVDDSATLCATSVFAVFVSVSWQTREKFLELKKLVGRRMMTDPISDMLTRIRNASQVRKANLEMPLSKMKYALAKILEKEGYVKSVETFEDGSRPMMRITLKYDGKMPAIESVQRVSRPGLRVYAKANELPSVRSGFGVAIISTSNGLMTNKEAQKRSLGGEVICEVY